MKSLISICIPTFCRPEFLEKALLSALDQIYPNVEILIGDDSNDSRSEDLVMNIAKRTARTLDYHRNVPSLGQNANVQQLIQRAKGERLVLLHDDDVLLPMALEVLDNVWQNQTRLAFGTQEIINVDGVVDREESRNLNAAYFRSSLQAGTQTSALESAFRQQIPNDGFLVTTALAQQIGYRSHAHVGVYCDLDFTLRLAQKIPDNAVIFVDSPTSQYRITPDAISTSAQSRTSEHPRAGLAVYCYAQAMVIPPELEKARNVLLERLTENALKGFCLLGKRWSATKVFCSPHYPRARRFSARGLYHALYIISPAVDRFVRR